MTNFYGIATRQDFFDAFGRYSQADIAPILGRYFK
jgi:hypothetical protein